MRKYWFRSKRYGWGWEPSSWEGWTVLGVFVVLVILVSLRLQDSPEPTGTMVVRKVLIPTFCLAGALIWICWVTGDKPRWRWGK